jgi:hypothetical protein
MRSVRFEASCSGGSPSAIGDRIEDVRIAGAIMRGAIAKAEEAIASSAFAGRSTTQTRPWSRDDIAAVQQLKKLGAACVELERALATPAYPAVSTATLPDARTLSTIAVVSKTIATVSAASMPSPATLKSIAVVEATLRPKG